MASVFGDEDHVSDDESSKRSLEEAEEPSPKRRKANAATKVTTTFSSSKSVKSFLKILDLLGKDDYVLLKWGRSGNTPLLQMDYMNSSSTIAVLATLSDPTCHVDVPNDGGGPVETNLLVDSFRSRFQTVNRLSTGRGKDLSTCVKYDPQNGEVWIQCEEAKGSVTTINRDEDEDRFDFAEQIGNYPVMIEVDLECFSCILREFCKTDISTDGVRISIEDRGPGEGGFMSFTAGDQASGTLSDRVELSEDTMVECRKHPDVMDSDDTYTSTVIGTIVKMAETCPKKSDSKTGADRRVSVAVMKGAPLYACIKLSTPMDPNGIASCVHTFVSPKIN